MTMLTTAEESPHHAGFSWAAYKFMCLPIDKKYVFTYISLIAGSTPAGSYGSHRSLHNQT